MREKSECVMSWETSLNKIFRVIALVINAIYVMIFGIAWDGNLIYSKSGPTTCLVPVPVLCAAELLRLMTDEMTFKEI